MSQEQASQIDKRLNKRLKDTPIAIVGMASLFAGSRYLNQFWDLICDKIDAITQVPADRWQVADYFDPDKKAADKSYCKRGGFIPEVDFNPMEFGLPPNILELTDTSQLLSLVVAKEVLEDAGIHEGSDYDRDRIGITLGIGGGQKISQSLNARLQYPVLKKVFRESGVSEQDSEMLIRKFQDQYIHWEENSFPGSLGNVIAGRIANRFDLGGMNCVVDAACAGSLAAMRMALTELTEGRSDMMLTGGVCTDNSAYMYMSFSKTPAFTSDEQIKPFDADSRGMMIGEGIGMVALKRLDDAERDGDRIYAVIKGVGASSDGKFKSIYAPRPEGQAKALRRAYDDAGFPPHTLGLMEAHGTGTAAGDVAEFSGLNAVMSQDNPELQHIALGSIKSQVGHTKSTAGTAGVIKAALALHHKVLPPTINVKQPNPKMAVEQSPFYLNTQTRPWMPRTDGTPRRAAVSSFGFGGTNFHLVLEEHSPELPKQPARLRRTPLPLLFCAPDKPALEHEITTLLKTLESDAHGDLETLCAPYRLGNQTQVQGPRLGLLACDTIELQQKLQQALNKLQSTAEEQPQTHWQQQGVEYRSAPLTEAKTAALFAGQGSQYLQMGSGLTQLYPELRAEFAAADREFSRQGVADKYGMGPLSARVFPIAKFSPQANKEDELALANTRFAQSAIGALGMGQFTLLCQAGFQADMLAGHSFGELSALRAAGALSRESYYALAFARGDAMASVPEDKDPGAMSAVILPSAAERNTLEQLLQTEPEVQIANFNSPVQLVIAGASEAVARLNLKLNEAGLRAIALPVSGAFHTPLVAHAQQPFAEAIARQGLSDAKTPLYVNATGDKLAQDAESLRANLEQHMLKPVRFSEQIESMYRDGARIFVEFGPKNTLARLAQTTLGDRAAECLFLSLDSPSCIDSLTADTELKQALISLALAGLPLTDPDAYRAVQTQAKHKASPMTIKLGASNYISPATARKMAASLKEGRVSQQTKIVEKVVEKIVEIPVAAASQNPSQPSQATAPQAANGLPANSGSGLQQFFSAQQQLAELHQQFLNIPLQYGNSVQQLLAEQVKLATAGKAIPDSLNQTLAMFHQHQAETLKIHNDFIQSQNLGAQQLLQQLQGGAVLPNIEQTQAVSVSMPAQAAAPVTHAAAPVKAASTPQQPNQVLQSRPQAPIPVPTIAVTTAKPSTGVEELMLQVVADKTGYPTEMLELGMDMEADLGIDSIKRVEILGTVQDQLPNLPQLDAATLSECRTLGQIVDYLQQSTGVNASVQPLLAQSNAAQSNTAHANQNDVTALMLQVVADKTGYPTEMLELGMDMEADLGIDSIKRVEILGTVQDALPELPQLDAATLSECRTLGQIVDYLQQSAGVDSSVQPEPIQPSPALSSTAHADQNDVTALMLQVVADKTGYPAEMLELGMDMEADLGIDSIKRVEILGTVQDALPELPQLDAATLSECRTLGQIVDYLQQSAGVNASVQPEPVSNKSDVTAIMLQVVADKTGYPAEMLELGMDMEADLGIDSIKRVEILGTVQDKLPELPLLDAASLSECRTLGQIIDCFAGSSAEHATEPLTQTYEMSNTQPSVALPPHSGVSLKKLPTADRFSGASAEALFAANSCALLLDDGHNAGVLAKKLTDSGISVTLVRPAATDSQSALDSKLPILTLASNDDAGVKALIAGLKQQVAIYIHLQPQLPREQLEELMPLNITAKTQVQLSFLFAKHLSPTWQAPTKGRRAFITVARMDGQLGFSGQPCELNQSALFGLTKTLAQEWPQVHCRALDLAPELDASALASQVMDALYSPSQDPLEWGKSAAGRVTLVATSTDDQIAADTGMAPCRLDSSDKILVTGGAKGVTLDCALALARESGSHFILAGRSKALALEAFPDWAKGLESGQLKAAAITALMAKGQKPSPKEVEALIKPLVNALEIHAALKRFEAIGASAEYLSLDVSNPDAVASTLAPIQALAPISGLIHGAGVLADKHIADKTLAELELVTGTKVGGLFALLRALAPNKKATEHLKLLALFSSAAGFYGNTGQSDYAMANEILNKTAHRLHHELPTTRVISFNWGPWDGGMVNAALKQMFESRGVYVIPREAGAKLFAEAILARSEPQLLIGSSMQGPDGKQGLNHTDTLEAQAGPQTLSRSIKRQELALLEDHCIGGNPVWPTVCALQWMLQSAQSLFGGDWRAVDYKLLKGVVFDTDEKRLQLSLTLGTDGELQASISCDERPQYQATLLPLIQQPLILQPLMPQHASQPLAHVSMTEIGEGEPQVRQGSEFYHSGALFHGPQLQAITEVLQFDDQGLSCRYRLPDAASSEDRALIQQDALLQAMLIWARLKYDAASLPSSLATLWQNALLPENDTGLIRLQVTKHSSRQLSADLALFNAEGQLQTGLENAKVTISKGLNAAFEPAKAATGNRERP
ncbi:SDR family NAD(P)-dependent oxidoreductase [Shewanella algae]|uniref:type I polyketide synthase n=1 Tax=Shewanella algae TaxID=38313 RepID=UPI001AAD6D0D|nr:type I polyketide synthase [Shewanella algae]MBO2625354.1 SDR family NAD(P)-dependent oxidoreductase [Shewanella algae]